MTCARRGRRHDACALRGCWCRSGARIRSDDGRRRARCGALAERPGGVFAVVAGADGRADGSGADFVAGRLPAVRADSLGGGAALGLILETGGGDAGSAFGAGAGATASPDSALPGSSADLPRFRRRPWAAHSSAGAVTQPRAVARPRRRNGRRTSVAGGRVRVGAAIGIAVGVAPALRESGRPSAGHGGWSGIVAPPSAVEQRSRAVAQRPRGVGEDLVRDGRAEHQRERGRQRNGRSAVAARRRRASTSLRLVIMSGTPVVERARSARRAHVRATPARAAS